MKNLVFLLLLLFSKVSFSQIKIGDKAPDINVTDWIQNQPKKSSLTNKFIVIDFWATWCAPCLASMAHMNVLVDQNKAKSNLIFLAMTDEKSENTLSVLSRVSFKACVVTDTTEQTFNRFAVKTIPHCVVIDDRGFVRWTGNPGQLSNDIIQDILAGKNPPNTGDETTTSGPTKNPYDSLRAEYRSIYDNNNIKEYFSLGSFQKEGYGSKYFANSPRSLQKVELGIKLRDIISEKTAISGSQISLPAELDEVYASYCYKSETRLKNDDILNSIFKTAKLTYTKADSVQKVFLLQVVDSNLFSKNFQKYERGAYSHISTSDKKDFISMSNFPISTMISALQDRFGCPVILKGDGVFNQPLDMMLQTDDLATLRKSLKVYGLSVEEAKQSLPFLKIVYK
jgi:thiol-disulfide isomerase/thioredoxin